MVFRTMDSHSHSHPHSHYHPHSHSHSILIPIPIIMPTLSLSHSHSHSHSHSLSFSAPFPTSFSLPPDEPSISIKLVCLFVKITKTCLCSEENQTACQNDTARTRTSKHTRTHKHVDGSNGRSSFAAHLISLAGNNPSICLSLCNQLAVKQLTAK